MKVLCDILCLVETFRIFTICTYMHMCVCVCAFTYIVVCMCVYLCVLVCVCMCVYVCVHMCLVCVRMHVLQHMHNGLTIVGDSDFNVSSNSIG